MVHLSVSLVLISIFSVGVLCQNQCFFPNGTTLPNTGIHRAFRPCSRNGPSTICCGTNRSNPPGNISNSTLGFTQDECLPNGLCQNRAIINTETVTTYWVNFCTNRNITGEGCLDICREERDYWGGAPITPCGDAGTTERWCCGETVDCCTNDLGVINLPRTFVGQISTASASTGASQSSTAASSSSSTSGATPSNASAGASTTPSPSETTSRQGNSGGLSSGAKAGIGVGVTAGVLGLAGAVFFIRKALSWRKKVKEAGGYAGDPNTYPNTYPVMEKYQFTAVPAGELSDTAAAAELPPNPPPPSELPGSGK